MTQTRRVRLTQTRRVRCTPTRRVRRHRIKKSAVTQTRRVRWTQTRRVRRHRQESEVTQTRRVNGDTDKKSEGQEDKIRVRLTYGHQIEWGLFPPQQTRRVAVDTDTTEWGDHRTRTSEVTQTRRVR